LSEVERLKAKLEAHLLNEVEIMRQVDALKPEEQKELAGYIHQVGVETTIRKLREKVPDSADMLEKIVRLFAGLAKQSPEELEKSKEILDRLLESMEEKKSA